MQTITKIGKDIYVMKNNELVSKRSYYTCYWAISFLSFAYLLTIDSKYRYIYIILTISAILLFFLLKYDSGKILFIFKKNKLEFQVIGKNQIKKNDIFNYNDILNLKVKEIVGKTGKSYNIEIILVNEEKSYYYTEIKEEAYKVVEIYNLYKNGDIDV